MARKLINRNMGLKIEIVTHIHQGCGTAFMVKVFSNFHC